MGTWRKKRETPMGKCRRAGVATIDYVLVLGVIFPLGTVMLYYGPKIMRLAYEMISVLVSWPFF
jgi:hypothetical protein